MKIGDEIAIKVRVIDFDSNPHGAAVKVEAKGFIDEEDVTRIRPFDKSVKFWIHRLNQADAIVK